MKTTINFNPVLTTKGFFYTQLNATPLNLTVIAIRNNLSKWTCANNQCRITMLRKTLHILLYLFHLLGQTSNLQAHDSVEEN